MAVQLILLLLSLPGLINAEDGLANTTDWPDLCPNQKCVTGLGDCKEYFAGGFHLCHCDELCVEYDDCCIDVAEGCLNQNANQSAVVATTVSRDIPMVGILHRDGSPQRGRKSPPVDDYMKCIQTRDFYPDQIAPRLGHRLISLCPEDWYDPTGIRELCEKDIGFVSSIQGTPVIGPNNSHYKNVFCAICYGVTPEDVTYWSTIYFKRYVHTNLPIEEFMHLDDHTRKQTMMRVLGTYTEEAIRTRNYEMRSPRSCILVDVSSCPLTNNGEVDPCRAHFTPIAYDGITYRNRLCIECHLSLSRSAERNLKRSLCDQLMFSLGGRVMSMSSLMIFSNQTELLNRWSIKKTLSGEVFCSPIQVYDPYIKQCRDLICPSGHVLTENGANCVEVQTSATITGVAIDVAIKLTVTGSFPDAKQSVLKSNTSWETVVHKSVDAFLLHVLLKDKGENDIPGNDDTLCNDRNVTWVCSSSVNPRALPSLGLCTQNNDFRCSVNISCECGAPPTDRLTNFNRMEQKTWGLWNNTIHLDAFTVATSCSLLSNESRNQTFLSGHRPTHFSAKTLTWDDSVGDFKETNFTDYCKILNFDCPLLKFSKTDYVFTGALNDSIKLTGYNDTIFPNGQYKLSDNGSVEVCNFLLKSTLTSDGDLNEMAQFILTVAGSSVSLIGLTITITTYIAFPTLRRNMAGKSLMSLVASLFFAQSTMLIGFHLNDVFELCRTFAIGGHFFWLSAFFWMNLLAIDIYSTFGVGTRLRNTNTSNRSFGYYAIFGWGSPTVIVCVCVFLSYCDCVDLDIHYGRTEACWLGGGTANLIAFGVPVALIISTNAVLFALTIIGIKITRHASGKMNITQGQGCSVKRANTDLFLYVKLSGIMGFTWIFGFIASLFNSPAFWYPYIVLNSTQGALVCLAFVCNRRVIAMWKTKLGFHTFDKSRSNSSSASALNKSCRSVVTLSEQIAAEGSSSINMSKI